MGTFTEDGACLPSWLLCSDSYEQGQAVYDLNFNNGVMRRGYVVGVHFPQDAGYEASTAVTYDVACEASIGSEASTWHVYYNVRLATRIGGTERDFSRFSLRAPRSKWDATKGLTEEEIAEASCVLIECENGQSERAYIVGFVDHPNLESDSKELGHNYRWDFNGISTTISKDGEFAITFSGAILDAGTNSYIKAPEATTGTFMRFLKDGSWTADNVKGESLKLDKTDKKTTLLGRSMALQTSEGDLNVTTKGKTNVQATGNAVFNSTKKVYIGKEGSTEPLVKGNELAAAFKALLEILSQPVIGQAGPFPCQNIYAANYKEWARVFAAKNTSPFLSRKGYVS